MSDRETIESRLSRLLTLAESFSDGLNSIKHLQEETIKLKAESELRLNQLEENMKTLLASKTEFQLALNDMKHAGESNSTEIVKFLEKLTEIKSQLDTDIDEHENEAGIHESEIWSEINSMIKTITDLNLKISEIAIKDNNNENRKQGWIKAGWMIFEKIVLYTAALAIAYFFFK